MAWQLSVQVCSEETNGQLEAQRLLSTLRAFELEECCETSLLVNLTADCPSKFPEMLDYKDLGGRIPNYQTSFWAIAMSVTGDTQINSSGLILGYQ